MPVHKTVLQALLSGICLFSIVQIRTGVREDVRRSLHSREDAAVYIEGSERYNAGEQHLPCCGTELPFIFYSNA